MLELEGVDAGYDGFQALFGVSMAVKAGEAVAVIGANGAGKTTLLRVISGLIPATGGTMRMEGTDLRRTAPHKILETGIAHVPESRRLFPQLSVESNLKMGAFIPAARARFAERLDYVYGLFPRLKERRTQLAGTLSGGEKQMLALARGLGTDPTVLLVDELSMGLAPKLVAVLYDVVAEVAAAGVSVLVVEQFAAVGLRHASHVYVMAHGMITYSGDAGGAVDAIQAAYLGSPLQEAAR
jgi:branched-chain amino acid transport system ATP-binding protein